MRGSKKYKRELLSLKNLGSLIFKSTKPTTHILSLFEEYTSRWLSIQQRYVWLWNKATALIESCTFSNARISICRTRSRLMLNSCESWSSVNG